MKTILYIALLGIIGILSAQAAPRKKHAQWSAWDAAHSEPQMLRPDPKNEARRKKGAGLRTELKRNLAADKATIPFWYSRFIQ